MKKTLLFSDVHLNVAEDGRAIMAAFTEFLRGIDPNTTGRIVIVGDLFDFWFEYRHVIFSGYFDVLRALADLNDAGVSIHFAVGNHDFWAGRFLRDHLGFIIHDQPFRLDFDGLEALVVHGDGINPKDRSYRLYKRFARWRPIVWLFGWIHPDWAMAIAQGVSRGSRHLFQAKDLSQGSEVAPLRAFARTMLERGDADIVVCGHSHFPEMTPFPGPASNGLYINTGDWLYHRSYVEWDGSAFTLKLWRPEAEDVVQAQVIPERQTAETRQ